MKLGNRRHNVHMMKWETGKEFLVDEYINKWLVLCLQGEKNRWRDLCIN